MSLVVCVNTFADFLWIDLHVARHAFGFCWRKPDGRPWYRLAWFYHKRPPLSGGLSE